MAYELEDIGAFLPTETHYKTPGMYKGALDAEAKKRAYYLSSMDQFYAQLDEMQQQFEDTLAFKTETRDLELAFEKEKLGAETKIAERGLDLQEWYNKAQIGLGYSQLRGTSEAEAEKLGLGQDKLGLEIDRLKLEQQRFGLDKAAYANKSQLFDLQMEQTQWLLKQMKEGKITPEGFQTGSKGLPKSGEVFVDEAPSKDDSGYRDYFNYGSSDYAGQNIGQDFGY